MRDFRQSLAHAIRVLRRNPGFTLSALAVLTLGIGANTAIFSVVNAVLLKPLPFTDSDSIVTVFHVPPAAAFPGLKRFPASVPNYFDWRKQNDVFESISMFGGRALRMGGGSRPQSLLTTESDADLFTVLRAKPAIGRLFTEAECAAGRDTVIVLSHGFAESHFGSPAKALGSQLVLNDRNYQVIGVMPPSFHVKSWFPASTQGWIPLALTDEERKARGDHNRLVVARLRPGISVAKAQSAMTVISDRLALDYPEETKDGEPLSPVCATISWVMLACRCYFCWAQSALSC